MTINFSPEFTAIQRELMIATELIGSGVTLLCKSNLMSLNYYWTAFFNLANGFERASKIMATIDHYIQEGRFLTNEKLKNDYGHSLKKLMQKIKEIHEQKCPVGFVFPSKPIHNSIISILSDFGQNTRYYNLDFLAGHNKKDPISEWDKNVTQKVLELHPPHQGKKIEMMDGFNLDDKVTCLATDVAGNTINSATKLLLLQEKRRYAIKYERMYVLQIARAFFEIAREISPNPPHIPYLTEILHRFGMDDQYFKSRKVWSPWKF